MIKVKTKKLVDCLTQAQRTDLDKMVSELTSGSNNKEKTTEAVDCNSDYHISENRIVARNSIMVNNLDVLAIYVAFNEKEVPINFDIIRPDVLGYITSDTKYKPIILQYSVSLQPIYNWVRNEI